MKTPKQYSLKKRLIWGTSIFSLLLGCLLIFTAYKIALHEVDEILDTQMQYMAERSTTQPLTPVASKVELHRTYHEEDLLVDIWAYKDQSHLWHQTHLLIPPVQQAGFYTQETPQGKWRVYVIPLKDYQIQVSQQEQVRKSFAWELAGSMFIPYVLLLPFAIIILAFIISLSLKPLDDFKAELQQRDSDGLAPIDSKEYPQELIPTIEEMNHLFERIQHAQAEQKQFIADAAHELRTPVTALNLQTKILMSQFPEHESLKNLSKGLARIQHLVTQLLALAKQDVGLMLIEPNTLFRLNDVALNCVEQLVNLAMQKEIDLGFERNDVIEMQSLESTVHSIIFNLIDNAIKYTPSQGIINISVYNENEDYACIQIEDSGSGIAPENYDKVLKRFYRVHHHLEVGSGLGLSIVDKATQRLGGTLQLGRSIDLGGLLVTVRLPKKLERHG
ncbi:two-component sensor histidine kinase [Acinetobacter venetianus]|uniref:sensor histidine kinase n=1 Tax=Acinetobacter TaxID=469 RepID=UPI0002FE418E|nr:MULTISPECIES: ATP-binding protein [Acinetobacter]MDA0697436.1 ATP-binding protein [Pseudomonadota bacterium]MBC67877.1 two-component sensor histidine kinase [Acinetobacter sp.]MBT50015.1 two-component sensor histidine kinase [Acinetobacter sp.]MCR4531505.1 ATP-binding protein [Acinetobacter venetianus]MDA1254313.1 ATP-binding protein [Pseudomonadota bacterium]|tara:strand:+ start:40 stop:1377 length:1338 start_codon:yes stop_codon:yes gene_type:complete